MSEKNQPEEEYFARVEAQKTEQLAKEIAKKEAAAAAAALKDLHYLHCGKCGTKMDTTTFKGVEIEVCPNCSAVLLDPGELQELAGEDHASVVEMVAGLFGFNKSKD
ncbi:MAG: zf-TFIIB domain-containing protein [Deltaproteobacteria bacterium]|nr:zf-TFIIB domain-containing protein [Deltaproteobacteria bacterium]